jgi:integrase
VTIPEKLVPLLERALAEQQECSLLFPSRAGTPINPRNLIRQFKELLTKAGLPDTIRFHDLRHTAASYALANGLDVKTTMEMLGHSQASTTLNIYAHVLKENRRDAVNVAVNKAFGDVVTDEEPQ